MRAKRTIQAVYIILPIAILLMATVACDDTGSSGYSARPIGTPTPTSHVGNLFDTQEAANVAADRSMQTAVADQLTAEAVNVTVTAQNVQTEEAREQILFDISLTNIAKTAAADEVKATQSAEETAIAHDNATAAAKAESDRATSIAQAKSDAATATAEQHGTQTAEAHAQATEVAKPTIAARDRIQAEEEAAHQRRMRQLESQERMAAVLEVLRVVGLLLLCALGLAFLWWVLPRLYHALALRLGGWRKQGARPTWAMARYSTQRQERRGLGKVLGLIGDFFAPWRGMQGMTTYIADRDPGSGQVVDVIEGTSQPLAGNQPTTALDQLADVFSRPAAAGGQTPSWAGAGQMARAIAQPAPYRVLPPAEKPPTKLIPPGDMDILEGQWSESDE